MRTIRLPKGAPRERGRAHGESFREAIHDIARIRIELALAMGGLRSESQLLEAARAHLPVLAAFDAPLNEELLGIAEGADLDPCRVVVLNHYTDLKDLTADALDEDCSALVAKTDEGVVLGQTWDMHGSAAPFVAAMYVPEHEARPAAWLVTITGCLGMTGMNEAGIGVTINNLTSRDARIGVVWPALVRRMLAERDGRGSKHVLLTAPMSSGHHYLIASDECAYGIETSGARKSVVFETNWENAGAYVHTNHCLGEEVGAVSAVAESSTTHERYAWLTRSMAERPIAGVRDLFARLGSHDGFPRSVCTHLASERDPHAMLTCAGIVMNLRERRAWTAAGCLHDAEPDELSFANEDCA